MRRHVEEEVYFAVRVPFVLTHDEGVPQPFEKLILQPGSILTVPRTATWDTTEIAGEQKWVPSEVECHVFGTGFTICSRKSFQIYRWCNGPYDKKTIDAGIWMPSGPVAQEKEEWKLKLQQVGGNIRIPCRQEYIPEEVLAQMILGKICVAIWEGFQYSPVQVISDSAYVAHSDSQ